MKLTAAVNPGANQRGPFRRHREFHAALPKLLKPEGLYSFFNGLAADNAFFHSVCCRVVTAELARYIFLKTDPLSSNASAAAVLPPSWPGAMSAQSPVMSPPGKVLYATNPVLLLSRLPYCHRQLRSRSLNS